MPSDFSGKSKTPTMSCIGMPEARARTYQHVVDEKVDLVRRPVHGIGVEVSHIDRQAYRLEIFCY